MGSLFKGIESSSVAGLQRIFPGHPASGHPLKTTLGRTWHCLGVHEGMEGRRRITHKIHGDGQRASRLRTAAGFDVIEKPGNDLLSRALGGQNQKLIPNVRVAGCGVEILALSLPQAPQFYGEVPI
jgi:hypothetical protein